ncbi:MAG: ABC transporter permease, partial [Dehalococcoidia bacterium]
MKTNPTWALTLASLKMWYRDRQALFWTLFLPLLIMVIFGLLNFGAFGSVNLGIVDQADSEASHTFTAGLESIETLHISRGESLEEERQTLTEGDRHLVLILPPTFGRSLEPTELQLLYNEGKPQEVQVGQTIIRQALNEMTFAVTNTPRLFTLNAQPVTSRNLRYMDFLMPGVVAMAIMQMG